MVTFLIDCSQVRILFSLITLQRYNTGERERTTVNGTKLWLIYLTKSLTIYRKSSIFISLKNIQIQTKWKILNSV